MLIYFVFCLSIFPFLFLIDHRYGYNYVTDLKGDDLNIFLNLIDAFVLYMLHTKILL